MWDVIVLVLQLGSFAVLVYGGIIAIRFSHLLSESSPSTFDEAKVIELPATSVRAQAERSGKSRLKRAA